MPWRAVHTGPAGRRPSPIHLLAFRAHALGQRRPLLAHRCRCRRGCAARRPSRSCTGPLGAGAQLATGGDGGELYLWEHDAASPDRPWRRQHTCRWPRRACRRGPGDALLLASLSALGRAAGATGRTCTTSPGRRTAPRWRLARWRTCALCGTRPRAGAGCAWRTTRTTSRAWPGTPWAPCCCRSARTAPAGGGTCPHQAAASWPGLLRRCQPLGGDAAPA